MLTTTSEIAFTSPLAAILSKQQTVSSEAVADAVGIADLSGQAVWHVRGENLTNLFDTEPSGVGAVVAVGNGLIAQPRADQYFLLNMTPDVQSSSDGESVLTVTDMTHGYGQFLLMGRDAASVLAKVCGLDFSDTAFPNDYIAQSSLAKIRASIIRHDRDDVPAYHILMGFPVAMYVWDVVFDAMQEFGGKIITV